MWCLTVVGLGGSGCHCLRTCHLGINDVSVSNSSVTLSCWKASVWGAAGANKGDGSVRIRVGLVWNTGIHSSVGGMVCISCKLNPCVICFNLSSGA